MPTQLSLEHKFRMSHSIGDIDVLLSLVLHLALIGYGSYLVWSSHKRSERTVIDGLAGFGIIWFYGTLMVESSIIPLNVMVAEYRTYLPSFGFFLFIACMGSTAIEKMFAHNNTSNLKYLFWLPILCLLMSLTIKRNEVWRKPDELWKQTIYLYPTLARAYANLADHYIRTGALQNAIMVYRLSIKEMPAQPVLHYELGNVYLLSKQYGLAITELQRAIIMKPDMGKAYTSLTKAYVFTGRFEQAVETSKMADRLNYGLR
jgi:tetratricopeptide (TPR) repeat protein